VNFGVIGYGYWGPNIVRNLTSLEDSQVLAIADMSPSARARAQKAYPGIRVTADAADVIQSVDIDAVAVISPVWTHYELAKAALENGKAFHQQRDSGGDVNQSCPAKESHDHG